MKASEVVDFFGGNQTEVAEIFGVTRSCIWQWIHRGDQVPKHRQFEVQVRTNGHFVAEGGLDDVVYDAR